MKKPSTLSHLTVTDLTHDGRGVAHHDGKTVFIENAVPGDVVTAQVVRHQPRHDEAELIEFETASAARTKPFCRYYAECGGCQLQHYDIDAQRHWKFEHFMTQLKRAVDTQDCESIPAITGEDKGYRRRARFGLAVSKRDKRARLGFRQRHSNELVDIEQCPTLTPALNQALEAHRPTLLEKASRAYKELNVVEADNGVFGFDPEQATSSEPFYRLNDLTLHFPADGFIQVNAELNRHMVDQALEWLELKPAHRVLDLFCGVGNFTLPIAQSTHSVCGVEGDSELLETASRNAQSNRLKNASFFKANLFEEFTQLPWFKKQHYDRILLDPGRQGAHAICQQIHSLKAGVIVYVSCNTATLIRDVKALEKQGYRLTKAGMIDLFPHTHHAEVMVQLKKQTKPKSKPQRRAFRF